MKIKRYYLRARSLFLLLLLLGTSSFLFSQQVAKTIPNATSPDGLIGFLEFKPTDYGTQKHPLIIFLHGIGERGNGTSQINSVKNNAIPMLCANGATMRFTVGGVTSSFVVLSPQLSVQYGYWPTFYVKEMIKYAKANLQIDTNRIYLTGLSLGGGGIWRVITDTYNFDHTFDAGIAAAAPVCGTQEENDFDFCSTIGANHLPIWAFHSMDDQVVGVGATQHAEILSNICGVTPKPIFTYYQSGDHWGAWVNAYDTGHITRQVNVGGSVTNFTANPNMYEWFLGKTRATGNTPPVANAGTAQTITLPTSNVTLNGSGAGTGGATVSSYAWTKTSGPAAGSIGSPATSSTGVTGLVQGVYVFTLTVTDNHGLSSSSTVSVTVNAAANQLPIANAGSNIAITLPTNNTTLNGAGSSDPDGSIASYAWSKTSGPATYTIANASAATTALTNLVQGVYVFTLQVKDNAGASATSTVTITVNAAPNQAPIANAGSNIAITLPTNNTTLNGAGSSDPDGSIATYAWSKSSGPATYTIANASAATTALTNLVQGVYVFTLQVTDNGGATASSTVTVTVNAAAPPPPPPANQAPVANAGSNINITLPANNTTLDGTGSSDPDGSIATYAWSKSSGPATYTIANASGATTALTNLVQGVYVFTLQVTDNGGATASANLTVTVNAAAPPPPPANQAPLANAGSNINITLPANNTSLDGTGSSDPDGSIASYAWSKSSGPATYTIASASAATTGLTNLVQGVYVFTLQVTDNGGATASSTVTVTVNAAAPPPPPANQAPVANAGSNIAITLPTNNTTLNGAGSSDPDGSIATYTWSKSSGPATYTIANASAATTALTNLVQGVYVFTLQVTDNGGSTASANLTVTVNPAPNQAPVANAGSDISITLPVNATQLNGSSSADADGSISTYSWNKINGPGAITIVNSNTPNPSVIGLSEGQYVFELTVTDNNGATAADQVIVTVLPIPNKAPVANAGSDTSIALPEAAITLSGTASADVDGSIIQYAWKQVAGPSAATIAQAGAVITLVNNLVEGEYEFELKITDNAGATATARVKVSVVNNFRYTQFFKLYPNPATTSIHFQYIDDKMGKLRALVYDLSGRLVMDEEFSKDQSLITKEFNISALKQGMYYLEITQAGNKKLIRPFVKQ
jgi:VCBS repeat-containing protein